MIVQRLNLVPRLDVASNVLHGILNKRSAVQTVFILWSRAGILDRHGIARALMQNPRIILADEPVTNLHTLFTTRRSCDRVIGMRDGRIVFDGTPEQLSTAVARDIYGADDSFNEDATCTVIPADTERLHRPARASLPPCGGGMGWGGLPEIPPMISTALTPA